MSASPSTVETTAPPWPLIHFDVHCARCGHDLRGQSEPVCPACKLEFTWDQAAPLEHLTCGKCSYHLYGIADSRCPECGTAVDWNEALLRYRRREKPLFEYHWRDRPVRSFVRTWLLSLRPRRLWQTVDMHDPPQVGPLLLWLFALILLMDVSCIALFAATQWGAAWLQSGQWPGAEWVTVILSILHHLTTLSWHQPMAIYVMWALFALAALMLFRQSMRIARVRTVHVIRVWTYAAGAGMPISAFGITLSFMVLDVVLSILDWPYRWRYGWLFQASGFFGLIALIHSTWSVARGYSHYLKMPHSFGIAIAIQLIAGMSVLILWLQLHYF